MENSIAQKIDEIVLVDKQEGITSYDVIRKLKYNYPKKTKIGHAGTLDPFASGLLIVLVGKFTKQQDEIHKLKKTYITKAIFNNSSSTLDRDGEITVLKNVVINEKEMEECITRYFLGEIEQTPPNFSAVHVNGKRAYDLAREGIKFELKPKKVNVFVYKILDFKWPEVTFEIECSTGTYVRSLVSDLGKKLGTDGYCVSLRRTSIGDYSVDDAIKLSIENKYER